MRSRLGMVVLGLVGITAWTLAHAYQGIFHDANLYALQALARIYPGLSNDVFLEYGSQDRFSIFSQIYAFAIRWLGFDHAAAALTFLFQTALLAAAWALARTLAAPALSLLGVGLLAAVPGTYGADQVFTCMESFLTPRMAAEALALAGLAAALTSRRWLATALIVTAALVHPIMAAAVMACLFILYLGFPRPRLAAATVISALVAYAAVALVVGGTTWGQFDARWLALIDARSPYLFITHWRLDDWAALCVVIATLAAGFVTLDDVRLKKFAAAVLLTTLAGIAITWIGADGLHLVLPTQVQPWRWQWLGTVASTLLLPTILGALWHSGAHGRSGALLLIAAWIFAGNVFAIAAAAAAIAAIMLVGYMRPQEARHVVWGSWLLLLIAAAFRIASNFEFTDVHYLDPTSALWLQRTMSFAHDGSFPLGLFGLTWYLAQTRRRMPALLALGVAAAVLYLALLPQAWLLWTASAYSAETMVKFAPLRARIPAGSEVFWPESPAAAWALLRTPSYLSVVQTSGLVFSRATAMELDRRAFALEKVIAPPSFMGWDTAAEHMNLSKEQLARACATGEFGFLVTHWDLGGESMAQITSGQPPKDLHLYRCAQARS